VGGEGVELQSIDLNSIVAAMKLREANYLLITAGAGFGADSGLKTYECAPAEYRNMCDPSKIMDDPHHFQQFWFKFTESYLETKPHIGYELIDQWCHLGRLTHLKRPTSKVGGWWVYSSNVDGHFREHFSNSLCEIPGKYVNSCQIALDIFFQLMHRSCVKSRIGSGV
jgi:NAD-dependent SIR2 family protein deacetylase